VGNFERSRKKKISLGGLPMMNSSSSKESVSGKRLKLKKEKKRKI